MAAPKLTVLIPNYNGARLLKKNIPLLIQFIEKEVPGTPIVVFDDGSTDDSIDVLKQYLGAIKVVTSKQNRGFAAAINTGMKRVSTPFVFFVNTDVEPRSGLAEALRILEEHPDWLGISARQTMPGDVAGGGAVPEFKYGLFRHRDAFLSKKNLAGPFPILYPSGGACLIRTEHFLLLNGFDPIFSPFYWEDADLGWRGWQKGLASMAVGNFEVFHDHSPSISKNFARSYVRSVAIRNLFYFNWRSLWGIGPWLLHFVFLPLHLLRALVTFDGAYLKGFYTAATTWPRVRVPFKHSESFSALYARAGGK